jgi:hypothetical protein
MESPKPHAASLGTKSLPASCLANENARSTFTLRASRVKAMIPVPIEAGPARTPCAMSHRSETTASATCGHACDHAYHHDASSVPYAPSFLGSVQCRLTPKLRVFVRIRGLRNGPRTGTNLKLLQTRRV